jgi:hypothetical protein
MIVVVVKAYTPRDFASQRYLILIKRTLKGRMFKEIRPDSKADGYGFLEGDVISEAKSWASLLKCEIHWPV